MNDVSRHPDADVTTERPISHRRARHGRPGRRRAGRLDRRARRDAGLARAIDLGARRRAAHRRDDLLRRDVPPNDGPRAGPVADAGARATSTS